MNRSTIVALGIAVAFAAACTRDNPGFTVGEPCGDAVACGEGAVCDPVKKICVCPQGLTLCGTACTDPSVSPDDCGACGLVCPANETCSAGRCSGGGCPAGAVDCGGRCVDPLTNPQHCGGCGNASGKRCGDGQLCVDGVCQRLPCAFGATQCGDRCVNLSSSAQHCGACGLACAAGKLCSQGICADACLPGLTRCGSACVDLSNDPMNCTECGKRCGDEEICVAHNGDGGCKDYTFGGCTSCPCSGCKDKSCCVVAAPSGSYQIVCIDGKCPQP